MAQVKITQDITIRANDVANVHYPKGYEGRATKAHADAIVAAGAGFRIDGKEEPEPGESDERPPA